MALLIGLVVITVYIGMAQARNDTIVHGWQPEPSGRGTWSIVWNCVTTVLLCTWSALHLEVPDWRTVHSDIRSWLRVEKPERYDSWWLFSRKFRRMVLAVFAPEIMIIDAVSGYIKAQYYAAQMPNLKSKGWTLTHLRFAEAGGFIYRTRDVEISSVHMRQLAELILSHKVGESPISEGELNSRSQSDWFIRGLAVFQILWFAIQVLVRTIQHLQNTALEITVIAFVLCSVAVYVFNWNLPQNVEYPVLLKGKNDAHPTTRIEELTRQRTEFLQLGLFGILFGAVHLLAWNSPFPSPGERLTWRICATSTIVLAPIISRGAYMNLTGDRSPGKAHRFTNLTLMTIVVLYAIGRITLIVLAFTALRALPADIYQTIDWTNYIPHFGT